MTKALAGQNMTGNPERLSALRRRLAASLATVALLSAMAGVASAQPPAGAGPPVRKAAEPRLGGLHIGPRGFTSGPGGGLDNEMTRNDPPPTPPLGQGYAGPSSDPRDFSGTWYGDQFKPAFEIMRDMYGAEVPFNVAGQKVMDSRLLAMDQGKPYMSPAILCRPSGPDWLLFPIATRFYQSKDRLDIFSTADHGLWSIALNPALLPSDEGKTYMGRSVAHWEGDTLVVENTNFKIRRWLTFRGTPVSPNGKLTYQIRKLRQGDNSYLEVVTTVDDPTYYARPWKFARSFAWRPDLALVDEFDCEEQIGSSSGVGDTGAIPEPHD